MTLSLDYLGMEHPLWPVNRTVNLTPAGTPIGVFDYEVFAGKKECPHTREHIDSGKFPIFRIQMWWGGSSHAIIPFDKLKNRLPFWQKIAERYPAVKFYLSHSCEHNDRRVEEVRKRLRSIEELAPSCVPVNSVWKGVHVPGYLLEHHGDGKLDANIVSTDGINAYDINLEAWKKANAGSILRFIWGYRYNLREIGDPGQNPPVPAQRRAVPPPQYLRALIRLLQPIGAPRARTWQGDVMPLTAPAIYKPFAEDDQEPRETDADEPRENRPVLIVRPKAARAELITFDGQNVGSFPYYGTFQGGMHRYYSGSPGGVGLYGEEIGRKALEKSGSEWVWFKLGNKYLGPVNPAFRHGAYR